MDYCGGKQLLRLPRYYSIVNVLFLGQQYMKVFFLCIPFFLLHFIGKAVFQGAAIGSGAARLVGSILEWSALLSGRFVVQVDFKDMIKPDWKRSKQIVAISIYSLQECG